MASFSKVGAYKTKVWLHPNQVIRTLITALLCLSLTWVSLPAVSAAQMTRSLIDRPDDTPGYQIHLVYVSVKGSVDNNWDTNSQIDAWAKEANNWLTARVGHKFIFDTYQGESDVTFMKSNYSAAELCYDSCKTLSKLEAEYQAQDISYNASKTLVFIIADRIDPSSCGWASTPSNLALLHGLGAGSCTTASAQARFGLSWPAVSLAHELIHTYGIDHQCFDTSDMMIGSPECPNARAEKLMTLDPNRNHYVGSEASDGIDLLKLPIWSDASGSSTYSLIKQTSDNKYLPALKDGRVYAVVGQKSDTFDWDWDKKFYPTGSGVKCQFTSGSLSLIGTIEDSACIFEVPNTLRAGKAFTVTQNWVEGPWHGEAAVTGVLVRKDYSSDICTYTTCIVGGTTEAPYACWTSDIKTLILQQLIDGKWIDVKTVATSTGTLCKSDSQSVNYPEATLDFNQAGTFIYRWLSPAQSGYSKYATTPFAVVVNDENSPEPSQADVDAAKTQALELGKAADLAKVAEEKAAAEKAAADALAAQKAAAAAAAAKAAAAKKKTITCVKGKLIKKVTAIKPVCPAGYKKK